MLWEKPIINNKIIIFGSAASAALLILSYPKFNFGFLAWFALAPFTVAIAHIKKRHNAFLFGYFTGFLFYAGLLYWIYNTCRTGGVSLPLSVLSWLILSGLLAFEWAFFGWCAHHFLKLGYFFPFAAAIVWTAIELVKVALFHYINWFPWFLIGYTQWEYPLLIQIVSLTGTCGLGFAIVFVSVSIGYAAVLRKSFLNCIKIILPAAAVFAFVLIFGLKEIKQSSDYENKNIKISVLQPNINQYKKWDKKYTDWIETRLSQQLDEAAKNNPQLVVWPESALPGWLENGKYKLWISTHARSSKAYHLIGSVSKRGRHYVSAFMVNPEGIFCGVYDKRQLVPFGETVPFKAVFEKYISVLNKLGDFTAGMSDQPLLEINNIKIGTSICYETIFPHLWRKNAKDGASIFVNITNDGWYLDTAGPYQHFIGNIFRAVENRIPVVRAANTGISGGIDSFGRIRKISLLNTETVMTFNMPIADLKKLSFYTKYGDVFGITCFFISIAFFVLLLPLWKK